MLFSFLLFFELKTKNDRASVLWDAIEYIRELRRSVDDLTLLVDKKRCGKERFKRHKVEEAEEALEDIESCNLKPLGEPDHRLHKCIIRSSWLQRKSKDTEVDIRIVEDEVTIKLVQRKKNINCLLYASKALDELELDIQHVAGGHIGDFCSFLFNSKVCENEYLNLNYPVKFYKKERTLQIMLTLLDAILFFMLHCRYIYIPASCIDVFLDLWF